MPVNIAENMAVVHIIEPKNYTGVAGTDDIFSMKFYSHASIVIQTGAWAGGTAAVTLSQMTDVTNSQTDAKTLGFDYMWTNDGAVTASPLTKTAVTSDTFDLDTAQAMYVIEIDAETLDVDGGFDSIRLNIATPGGNNDYYSVVAYLSGARHLPAKDPLVN